MTPQELVELVESRDALVATLKIVQDTIDAAYEAFDPNLVLFEMKQGYQWKFKKSNRWSIMYASEKEALQAFADKNIIDFETPQVQETL